MLMADVCRNMKVYAYQKLNHHWSTNTCKFAQVRVSQAYTVNVQEEKLLRP
jgi:hypothetical protein